MPTFEWLFLKNLRSETLGRIQNLDPHRLMSRLKSKTTPGDRIPLDQRQQGFHEVCDWLKGNRGITEHVSVPSQTQVGFQVNENQRGRSNHTAGRRMRTRQRHIYRGGSQAVNLWG
jgi:hypothetical protein